MIDRRSFTTAAIGTLVTVGLSAVDAPTAHARQRKLSAEWWKKRLDRQVQLQGDSWHLVEVEAVHDVSNTKLEQFTVVFRGTAGDPVTEGIYAVTSVPMAAVVNERRSIILASPDLFPAHRAFQALQILYRGHQPNNSLV